MSLLDDITGALNGITTALPELTGTVTTKNGQPITVVFSSLSRSQQQTEQGMMEQPVSDFKLLQANFPETGMNPGDPLTVTDTRTGKAYNVRVLNVFNTLNFVKVYFQQV